MLMFSRMAKPNTDLVKSLRSSISRMAREQRAHGNTARMGMAPLLALLTLSKEGPMTPTELATREKVRKPSITRVLAYLENEGLVQREPHPTDGRQVIMVVTPAGTDRLDQDRRQIDAWYASRLGELSPSELEILAKAAPILERLAGIEGRVDDGAAPAGSSTRNGPSAEEHSNGHR